MATDGNGNWVAVWTSSADINGYGSDPDILSARSSDDGATWSDPIAVNHFAATEGVRGTGDNRPAIAADGSGNWIVA